ncbi:hypothetical protein F511_20124 [Dorcoceras hygrometricum]|uniref:Uncharacterized protein n=1 Tax=Dorcoceras hygrometricum TaxID=472368 RepID=A0A2Z7A9T4_9LAMI|nr:hypothetical protein F511_20124 [Dorcoceras hygrometricum]
MNLSTFAIQEEEELQAGAGDGAGLMKKSAGALSVDDISNDVIIQQGATLAISRWISVDDVILTSSYSADGLRDQSQESAGSLHPDARRSDVVEKLSSRKLQCNQQMLFGIQQGEFALLSSRKIQSQRKDFQTQCLLIQTQEDKSIIVEEDSGEAFDGPDASAASSRWENQSRATVSSRK